MALETTKLSSSVLHVDTYSAGHFGSATGAEAFALLAVVPVKVVLLSARAPVIQLHFSRFDGGLVSGSVVVMRCDGSVEESLTANLTAVMLWQRIQAHENRELLVCMCMEACLQEVREDGIHLCAVELLPEIANLHPSSRSIQEIKTHLQPSQSIRTDQNQVAAGGRGCVNIRLLYFEL